MRLSMDMLPFFYVTIGISHSSHSNTLLSIYTFNAVDGSDNVVSTDKGH